MVSTNTQWIAQDALTIRTLAGSATPVLLERWLVQSRFEWGQITQYDELGVIVSQLTLGNVLLASSQTTDWPTANLPKSMDWSIRLSDNKWVPRQPSGILLPIERSLGEGV